MIDDVLALHQTSGEQTLYRHLCRLAYGFGNTHCLAGYDVLCKRCNMTRNTIRKTLAQLAEKGHIDILETVNTSSRRGTVYRVYLPDEIKGIEQEVEDYKAGAKIDTVANSDTVAKIDIA